MIIIKYRIYEKDNYKVVGKSIAVTMKNQHEVIPKFWRELLEDELLNELFKSTSNKPVLAVSYDRNDEGYKFLIGIEVENNTWDSFEEIEIPKSTWAIFDAIGPIERSMPELWSNINSKFWKDGEYKHAGTAEIELYNGTNVHSEDYKCEIWVPVIS